MLFLPRLNRIWHRCQQWPWVLYLNEQDLSEQDDGGALGLQLRDFLHTEFGSVEPSGNAFQSLLRTIEARQKNNLLHLLPDIRQSTYRTLSIHTRLAVMLTLVLLSTSAVQPFMRESTITVMEVSVHYLPTPRTGLTGTAFSKEKSEDHPRIAWLSPDEVQVTSMYDQDEFRESRLAQCTEQRRCRQGEHPEYRARGSGF